MTVATYRRNFVDQTTTVSDFLCTLANVKSEVAIFDFEKTYVVEVSPSSVVFQTTALKSQLRHPVFLTGCILLFLQWLRSYGIFQYVVFRVVRRKSGAVEVSMNLNGTGSSKHDLVSAIIDFRDDVATQMSSINDAMTQIWPMISVVRILSQFRLHADVRVSALLALFPQFSHVKDDGQNREVFVEDRVGSGLVYLIKLANGVFEDEVDMTMWAPTRNSFAQLLFDDKHELWAAHIVRTGAADFVETFSRLPSVQCFWFANNSQLTILPEGLVCSLPLLPFGGMGWIAEVANTTKACLPNMFSSLVSCISVRSNDDDANTCSVIIALAPSVARPFHPPGWFCLPLPVAQEDLCQLIDNRTVKRLVVCTEDCFVVRRVVLTVVALKMIHYNTGLTMTCKVVGSPEFRLVIDADNRPDTWTVLSSKLLPMLQPTRDTCASCTKHPKKKSHHSRSKRFTTPS